VIVVTRLNGESFTVNPDLIERVEAHPDTVVYLSSNSRYLVRESVADIVLAVRDYRADVLATAYAMDRGAYPRLQIVAVDSPLDDVPRAAGRGPAVLTFPHREER
jgi:flagellar protein FlbD